MKKTLFIISIIIIAIIVFFYFYNSNNSSNSNNIDISRTSENIIYNESSKSIPKEEELYKFSTKIYTKDSNRQNNLSITCSALNGHIVKSSETFSFTKTLGPATSDKGYQEADIYDSDGNKIKGLGGGKCQVSSTLYNAVLNTPNLEVIERHEHSNKVPYVAEGKDAAVAYGSVDFKFKNNNNFDLKINADTDGEYVTITLLKIE